MKNLKKQQQKNSMTKKFSKMTLPRFGEMGISMGNSAHEGENLRQMLSWANNTFEKSFITLSDTLYRFNLLDEGLSEEEALQASRAMGDAWLQRNTPILESFDSERLQLKRWDEWRTHPHFNEIYNDLHDYYRNDKAFHEETNRDIEAFALRRIKSGKAAPSETSSLNFLLEEGACYILIGRTWQSLRIYPSHDLRCFKYLRKDIVPPHLKGLERAPYFDYRRVSKHTDATANQNENKAVNLPVNKFG